MDGNVELLNYIHQNAERGVETLKQLAQITQDAEFKNEILREYAGYEKIFHECSHEIESRQQEIKDINAFSKISTHTMINLNTLLDKTPSHMAEMLIQGSTMGIIDATKKMKEYQGAEQEILQLAQKLLEFEQNNIESLKNYL